MENKFTRYIAAGASALAAFFIAVISFLSSRLKSEKKKEPESVPAPSGPDERLERLNRLSDRK